MEKATVADLTIQCCLDILDKNLLQMEGVLGAMECSRALDERLVRTCSFSLGEVAEESKEVATHLRLLIAKARV